MLVERLSSLNDLAAAFDQAFCWYIYPFPKWLSGLATSLLPAVEGAARSCVPSVWLFCCVTCARATSSTIWLLATSPIKVRFDSELHKTDLWWNTHTLLISL